jgi:DNA processing protein
MSSPSYNSVCDWVALSFVTGVGSRTAAMLLDGFGSPTACFEASRTALSSFGLKREAIEAIKSSEPRERAIKQLEDLARISGEAIALSDDRYPSLLRETYDPPIVLYVRGAFDRAIAQPAVAIVGSRHCSTYGRNVGEMLARELGERGITIISGLARGIDSAAHAGAVACGGLTIAVMGTGLETIYPKENRRLSDQIAEQGALVTEFPLDTPPLPQNFPFRNRVISGLSLGVLIVEGAERSGSLITARMAYEQGREVFAVPGNITSSKSFGPNYLIKDGAKLVQTWRDVVEEFPLEVKAAILSSERAEKSAVQLSIDEVAMSDAERRLLAILKDDDPLHIDQLISSAGLKTGELMGALLKLEMLDRVRQLPGKSFIRKI